LLKKAYGEEHVETAKAYGNIATIYKSIGDYDKALDYIKKVLEIYKNNELIELYLKYFIKNFYLFIIIKSKGKTSSNKLYKVLCDYFVFLEENKTKISEMEIFRNFINLAEILIENGIVLEKNKKFKVYICSDIYKNFFYPIYEELKKTRKDN